MPFDVACLANNHVLDYGVAGLRQTLRGLEYEPFPPPYVVAAFRALVEAGADCVIGHHPHVPQGIEWWRGRAIFHSLGDVVFSQPTTLLHRRIGFCVSLRCERGAIAGVELHPYRIADAGLRRLDAKEARAFSRNPNPRRTTAIPRRGSGWS